LNSDSKRKPPVKLSLDRHVEYQEAIAGDRVR